MHLVVQRLRNCRTGEILAERVSRATSPWDRVVGYLGRRAVDASEGLWFDRCATIHTVGMRARIDVLFVDGAGRIVRIVCAAPRNRIFHGGSHAVATIELGSGLAEQRELLVGDRVTLE